MTRLSMLIVFLCSLGTITRATTTTIKACPTYGQNTIRQGEPTPANLRIQTEEEIADQGHFSGLKPLTYSLMMTFRNLTNYYVSMKLDANVTDSTKHLMLNVHQASLSCNFSLISIQVKTADNDFPETCIDSFIYVETSQVLVIQLTNNLPQNSICSINFPACTSFAYDEKLNIGAKGLRMFTQDQSQVVYSNFQKRRARTVFPCMDHPSLKAEFRLCLHYSSAFSVASTMHAKSSPGDEKRPRSLSWQCFQKTPSIAPSSLSFALMKSYEELVSDNSKVSLLVPVDKKDRFQWIPNAAEQLLENIADGEAFQLPFPRLKFLIIYPEMPLGPISFGLVTLNGTEMEREYDLAENVAALYRAIVHQWLGNVVTVKNWKEICIQDGFVSYFSWLFVNARDSSNWITDQAQQGVAYGQHRRVASLLEESDDDNESNSANCRMLAPVIFYDFFQLSDHSYAATFLKQFVSNYTYANAGIGEWDEALEKTRKNVPFSQISYLQSWFNNPSPLKLFVSRSTFERVDDTEFIVKTEDSNAVFPRSAFFKMYCSTGKQPRYVVGNATSISYLLDLPTRWCLADPDGLTLTYKIYDVRTYRNVLVRPNDNHGHLTEKRRERFVEDFCTVLLNDFLPSGTLCELASWEGFFHFARRIIPKNTICWCCMTSIAERDKDPWCRQEAEQCDRLSLINYVFPRSGI